MYTAPRPRMRITSPLLRGSGELHIVGSERVVTVADPDGAIHRLVELADGSRSTNELFAALAPEYPSLQHHEVVDAVSQLQTAGVFENRPARSGDPDSVTLTDPDAAMRRRGEPAAHRS